MSIYIVKSQDSNFDMVEQPEGFKVISALENRMFICESPSLPLSEFVIEFPAEEYAKMLFYPFANGKRLWFDPFEGQVTFGEDVDSKRRRAVQYTDEQLAIRLSILKWLMLNIWVPDKKRMYDIPNNMVDEYITKINEFSNDVEARTYLEKNLYYNL